MGNALHIPFHPGALNAAVKFQTELLNSEGNALAPYHVSLPVNHMFQTLL